MFSCKEARKYTKENISGKAGKIIGYVILFYIMRGLIMALINQTDGTLEMVLTIVVAGIVTPLQVGLYRIVTNIMNGKSASAGMLFADYKYFVNLFVIGLAFNLLITVGYKIYVVGIFLEMIYIGVLYFFIYNSDLSLGDFFNKLLEKIKLYFSECVLLELSYLWPFMVSIAVYVVTAVTLAVFLLASGLEKATDLSKTGKFSTVELYQLLGSAVPIIIVTIIFLIVMLVLFFRIIPRLLLAEAKFYSAFGNENNNPQPANNVQTNNQQPANDVNFCPNCGSKVEGNFCQNCGNKVKE